MNDPWGDVLREIAKNLAGVIVGWGLGVASAVIIEGRKEKKKIGASKRAVAVELADIAHRFLGAVYMVESRAGRLNRSLLEWMLPRLEKYSGPIPIRGCSAASRVYLPRKTTK